MKYHSHCPDGCEHPQPFKAKLNPIVAINSDLPFEEQEWCGRCFYKFNELIIMIPCTPKICENE